MKICRNIHENRQKYVVNIGKYRQKYVLKLEINKLEICRNIHENRQVVIDVIGDANDNNTFGLILTIYIPSIYTYFKHIYTYLYIFSCIFLLISTYLPHISTYFYIFTPIFMYISTYFYIFTPIFYMQSITSITTCLGYYLPRPDPHNSVLLYYSLPQKCGTFIEYIIKRHYVANNDTEVCYFTDNSKVRCFIKSTSNTSSEV